MLSVPSFPLVCRLEQYCPFLRAFSTPSDRDSTRCPYQEQRSIIMPPNSSLQHALLLSATLGLARAVSLPDPTAAPAKVEVRAPIVTPAAIRFDDRYSYVQRRDILDNIKSGVDGIAKSWGSVLGTDLPSFFTDGKLRVSGTLAKACADQSRHPWLVREPPDRYQRPFKLRHWRRRPRCHPHPGPQRSTIRELDRPGLERTFSRQCIQDPRYLAVEDR